MSNDAVCTLNKSFADLALFLANLPPKIDVTHCDVLMHLSLRVMSKLVREELCRDIAKTFSLVVKSADVVSAEHALRHGLEWVDGGLEEHLRGFSNLLDFVLEDAYVERDAQYLLNSVDEAFSHVLPPFAEGAALLERYLDVTDIFDFDAINAAAVMMLWIIDRLLSSQGIKEKHIFSHWIATRAGKTLVDLYHLDPLGDMQLAKGVVSKDHLMIVLCNKAAHSELVHKHEIAPLDQALLDAGMHGIYPFIESGFLATAEDAIDSMISEKETKTPSFLQIVKTL